MVSLSVRKIIHSLVVSMVAEVAKDSVTLGDGTIIPCGLVVWSTGLAPRHFTSTVQLPKNKRGQVGRLQCTASVPVQDAISS